MKARELQNLSENELNSKLQDMQKELMELHFKRRTGVEKPHRFKRIKRTVARILTVLNERKTK